MRPIKILVSGISVFLFLWAPHAFSDQTFSCPYGARAACLGYLDKVVEDSATCFSLGTCGYEGFICKNKYDSVLRKYDELVGSYNAIVDENRKLVELGQELSDENQRLANDNQRLVNDYNALLEKYKQLKHKK